MIWLVLFIAIIIYAFFVSPQRREQQRKTRELAFIKGFIRGFLLTAPVPGYFGSAMAVAEREMERLKAVKIPPEIGSDPFYYAASSEDFGMLCIEEYARQDRMDDLLEYCEKYRFETNRFQTWGSP